VAANCTDGKLRLPVVLMGFGLRFWAFAFVLYWALDENGFGSTSKVI